MILFIFHFFFKYSRSNYRRGGRGGKFFFFFFYKAPLAPAKAATEGRGQVLKNLKENFGGGDVGARGGEGKKKMLPAPFLTREETKILVLLSASVETPVFQQLFTKRC